MNEGRVQLKRKSESLSRLSSYTESSSETDEEEDVKGGKVTLTQLKTIVDSSESDSETDSGSVISLDSDFSDESESNEDPRPTFSGTKPRSGRVRGELLDLPPIEDLKISVKEEECELFGRVQNIIDKLVVIESLPNIPVLDMESVLFKKSGEPLGRIFDIFGPPKKPYYTLRFTSKEEIHKKGVVVGGRIYYSPRTKHTQFVFIHDALATIGKNGSWTEHSLDISDDDEVQATLRRHMKRRILLRETSLLRKFDSSPQSAKTFEERMNEKNILRNQMFIIPPPAKADEESTPEESWYNPPSRRMEAFKNQRVRRGPLRTAVHPPAAWYTPPNAVFCLRPGLPLRSSFLPSAPPPPPQTPSCFSSYVPIQRRPVSSKPISYPTFLPQSNPVLPYYNNMPASSFSLPYRPNNPTFMGQYLSAVDFAPVSNFNNFLLQQQRSGNSSPYPFHGCNHHIGYSSQVVPIGTSYIHLRPNNLSYRNQMNSSKSSGMPPYGFHSPSQNWPTSFSFHQRIPSANLPAMHNGSNKNSNAPRLTSINSPYFSRSGNHASQQMKSNNFVLEREDSNIRKVRQKLSNTSLSNTKPKGCNTRNDKIVISHRGTNCTNSEICSKQNGPNGVLNGLPRSPQNESKCFSTSIKESSLVKSDVPLSPSQPLSGSPDH